MSHISGEASFNSNIIVSTSVPPFSSPAFIFSRILSFIATISFYITFCHFIDLINDFVPYEGARPNTPFSLKLKFGLISSTARNG
jgi:hypothetical protein